jgi:hypothetical protein
MTNIRFFLELVGSVNADVVSVLLYCTLFTLCYLKTQHGLSKIIFYVSSLLKNLMFKEISLVFLFKVNRDFSISSVIILKLIGINIKINANI